MCGSSWKFAVRITNTLYLRRSAIYAKNIEVIYNFKGIEACSLKFYKRKFHG